MTAEEYRALLAVDFEDVESGGLTDISKLRIDKGLILSILVDTFFTRISMPKLQLPESRNISAA